MQIADKTVAVARHHTDLAHAFAQSQCGSNTAGEVCAPNDFQQFHDVRRAEEMQTEHLRRTPCRSGNRIDSPVPM